MGNRLSITEAAKRVGISRPRLSKLIADAGLKTERVGKNAFVDLLQVQELLMKLASENKMRTPPKTRSGGKAAEEIGNHLREELHRLKVERDVLADRVRALEATQTELKLLRATNSEKDAKVEELASKVLELEAQLQEEQKAKLKRLEKLESSRLGKILSTFI